MRETNGRLPSQAVPDHVWLALAGLVLLVAQYALIVTTRGLTHVNAETIAAVRPLIVGLAVPTALMLAAALWLVRQPDTRAGWLVLVGIGLALRALWLGHVPPLDDDYFRYLWDGALVANGLDPYYWAPDDFISHQGRGTATHQALAVAGKTVLANINFPEYRTIYPSVAQAAFALGYGIAPFKVDGLRLVFLAGEALTLWLLVDLLRTLGASRRWAILYWWNPFAATMTIGIVHVDALIPPLVLGALAAHLRGRSFLALALLGLGAGVKVWPILLAPVILWPMLREPRRLLIGCAVTGAALLVAMGPVLWSTLRPASGLVGYATSWTNNNAFYAWVLLGLKNGLGLERAEPMLRLALAAATAVIALWAAVRRPATAEALATRFMIVAAAVFYLSPAQFPWYAVWFLPLAALLRSMPLLLASVFLPFYYLFFPHWPLEQGSLFFYGIAFIHSVPVLAAFLIERYRGRPLWNAR